MDYSQSFFGLFKESVQLKNFKSMSLQDAILSAVVSIPTILLYCITMIFYGFCIIMIKFISAPCDYLLSFLKTETSQLSEAPKTVFYLICLPFIYILKIILSLFSLYIYFLHMLATILGFYATIGGIKFKPFLSDIVNRDYSFSTLSTKNTCMIYWITGLAVFLITVISWINIGASDVNYFSAIGIQLSNAFAMFTGMGEFNLETFAGLLTIMYSVFKLIFVPICLRIKEKESN